MRNVKTLLMVLVTPLFLAASDRGYVPPKGVVPDAPTAIAIAVAVWRPIYGESVIEGERPITATLYDDYWWVQGTVPEGRTGGATMARISKADGRVLFIWAEK